jgi:hypothetical protein
MTLNLRGGEIAEPTSWKSACVPHSRRNSIDRQEYRVKQLFPIVSARFGLRGKNWRY